MSFFSIFSDVWKGIKTVVSDVYDTVTEIGSHVSRKIEEGIQWVDENLSSLFNRPPRRTSCPPGRYKDNAVQANNHLAKTRKEMAEYAANAEEKLIDAIMEQYKKTFDIFRATMQEKGLDKILAIDFDELQKKSNELTESVKGNLECYYNDHLVATNERVKAILEETDYVNRQKNLIPTVRRCTRKHWTI